MLALAVLLHCSTAQADFFNQQTIQRFAPLLVMHSSEDNGPASAQWFLDRSGLWFSESIPCPDKKIHPGPWSAGAVAKLGLGVSSASRWQYQNKGFICARNGATFLATDYTRPYNSGRALGLNRDEGFYLDLDRDNGAIGGIPFSRDRGHREFRTEAPIYYDDGRLLGGSGSAGQPTTAYISYWFFYAFNDAPPFRLLFDHEGDWENMSLLFEKAPDSQLWLLEAVSYSAHGAPKGIDAACPGAVYASRPLSCPVPRTTWDGLPRLVGFVADGSHASYPFPGPHRLHGPVKDHTSSVASGFSWPTWQTLLPLESQAWAGFCGAWGEVGKPYLPFAADRTGPLGPGCLDEQERQRKSGRPKSWGVSRSSPQDRNATPGQAVGIDPAQLPRERGR